MASKTKVKILRLFFYYSNREFSTHEVLKDAKIGSGYGSKCLKMLAGAGLLKVNKVGKEIRYSLNKKSEIYEPLLEIFENEKKNYPGLSYLHKGLLAEVIEKLEGITLILFGSVAAGTATPKSDVDLLIVSSESEKKIRKKLGIVEGRYGVEIQPIILSESKLKEMIEEKSRLIKNISRESLFLRGNKKILEMIKTV